MAGTPLAPLLATLYLRDLDDEVAATGATYARYSDDIVVLAPPDDLAALERLLRARLAERGLEVNEAKSASTAPGEPWDFLGFRYADGTIGLAPITERKLRARSTRAGPACPAVAGAAGRRAPTGRCWSLVRRTNRRLYGVAASAATSRGRRGSCPCSTAPTDLPALDEHVQREARYAATGRRTARARAQVPYPQLTPPATCRWSPRTGPGAPDLRRTTPWSRPAPACRSSADPGQLGGDHGPQPLERCRVDPLGLEHRHAGHSGRRATARCRPARDAESRPTSGDHCS